VAGFHGPERKIEREAIQRFEALRVGLQTVFVEKNPLWRDRSADPLSGAQLLQAQTLQEIA